jgi:hypothetical protein
MLRIIAKLFGLIALAMTVITAVLDLTRSIANSALTITALGEEWSSIHANSLIGFQGVIEKNIGSPWIFNALVIPILSVPSWLVFGILAIVFLWLGRRKERRWRQRFGS